MRVWKVVKQEYTREYTLPNNLNLLKYSNKSISILLLECHKSIDILYITTFFLKYGIKITATACF